MIRNLFLKRALSFLNTPLANIMPLPRDIAPPIHRGMTLLDRSKFTTTLTCLAARIDERKVGELTKDSLLKK